MPGIVELRVQTEKVFKRCQRVEKNSYVIPVWSGKTVFEMLFVESTSLILPIYLALPLQPLTELDCRVVPYDSKMCTIKQLDVVSPPRPPPNTSSQQICSFCICQMCTNRLRPYLLVLMASV